MTTENESRPKRKRKTTVEEAARAEPVLERTLPHDLEMERGILGSILLDPNVCDDIIPLLRKEDFYLEAHQILYHHLVELCGAGKQVDARILLNQLQKKGDLERIGGQAYLAEIVQSVAVTAHAKTYAEIVRDKAMLRGLIFASTNILQDAYDPNIEISQLVSQAEERIFAVHDARRSDSVSELGEVLTEVWDKITLYTEQGGSIGLPTGFERFDKMTGGLHPAELIILAARPSMGKTALATNIAEYVTVDQGKCAIFVSLEMTKAELLTRILCGRAGVDGQALRSGRLSYADRNKLQHTSSVMMNAKLFIDDSPSRTVSEIAAIARRIQKRAIREGENLDLLVIDYLQLIQPDNPRDPRQEQVARIARRLKALARELKVPVICLSQLNRQAEEGSNHKPKMSHLRESGAIEQDADVVIFVHREEYYHTGNEEYIEKHNLKGKAEIIIAKQRNGPTGDVKLGWLANRTKFCNLAYQQDEYSEFSSDDGFI
ncbi:MAG: replicative DNA helicase [Planctomycetia bacterium]|nr:replicative DNA helicase [Planctomycetia bacterium]